MPYKTENNGIYIKRSHDRRVKLTPEQRIEIRENAEGLSQRALADRYGVSRRLIQFIQNPDKRCENLKRRKERGGSKQYYNTEKHKEYMKKHRKYKRKIHDEGGTFYDESRR